VLVDRHTAAAHRTAAMLGAAPDIDDVVQEAFVKAYRRLGSYRGEAPFRAWLLAIVANETRNLHRSRRRRDAATAREAVLAGPSCADRAEPGQATLAAEDRQALLAAVRTLGEADRRVITYRYLLDLSEAETARLLDWPQGTVKSRAARALTRLRTRLAAALVAGALVIGIVAVPPARRAVAQVIGAVLQFAGVELHHGQSVVRLRPSPLPSVRRVSLAEAKQLATFHIGVPAGLGVPDRVELADPTATGAPRVVTLIYRGGAVRLDEFDGRADPSFNKSVADVVWLDVAGAPALWLPTPHAVEYVDRTGVSHVETARLSGPTLLWTVGLVAYRLEGVDSLPDALAVADSLPD
jgi:RNA polymerase sigma factor (sigma-70 family)